MLIKVSHESPVSILDISAKYNDFDYSVADFFLKKIDVFLDIFNSSKIYLVFPNIFVKHSDLEKWNNYLNEFKEFMKKQKVKIIFYHKTFYKDRELFLDTYSHTDNVLRDKNSLEINNFVFKNN